MRARTLLTAACAAVALAIAGGGAQAKPKAADAGPRATPMPADAVKRLRSADLDQIKSALDDVRTSGKGGAAAAPVIAELLERGLPPVLTQAAIDTLADTEAEAGSGALSVYAHHRNVQLRRAAVQALTKTRGAV